MEKYIVDRFEGDFAVLEKESGGTIDVPKKNIPDAKEGDVLILVNGIYKVSLEETQIRKELIAEKMRKLFEKR